MNRVIAISLSILRAVLLCLILSTLYKHSQTAPLNFTNIALAFVGISAIRLWGSFSAFMRGKNVGVLLAHKKFADMLVSVSKQR